MTRGLAGAIAIVLSAASLASAQPARPASEGSPARAEDVGSSELSRFERLLNAIEQRGLWNNLPVPQDGLALRIGPLDDGGHIAVGPLWRYARLADGRFEIDASAAVSLNHDREVTGAIRLPYVWRDRARVTISATATERPHADFYGLGPESLLAYRNSFEIGRRSIRAGFRIAPARSLEIQASTALLSAHLRNLGGLDVAGADFNFLHSQLDVTVDHRDRAANPRRGGRYHVALQRFAGPAEDWTSFNRVDTDLEQHIPVWSDRHTVTLRLVASLSNPNEGHDVPFYLMPTLGGTRLLRGFAYERFRDRNHVVLQGEYGWDLTRTLNAMLFYERGAVSPRVSDFRLSDMRSDYGVGFRIGSPRFVALRTDVAFGSGEGARLALRFNYGF